MGKSDRSTCDRQIDEIIMDAYQLRPENRVAYKLHRMHITYQDFRDYCGRTALRSDIDCNVSGALNALEKGIALPEETNLITPLQEKK